MSAWIKTGECNIQILNSLSFTFIVTHIFGSFAKIRYINGEYNIKPGMKDICNMNLNIASQTRDIPLAVDTNGQFILNALIIDPG